MTYRHTMEETVVPTEKEKSDGFEEVPVIPLIDYKKESITNIHDIENLRKIANKPLKELTKNWNSRLIVFPKEIGDNYDGVEDSKIINMSESGDTAFVEATDLLGFIGIDDTFLSIGTRFTGDKDKEDFFLHYLLQKVLKINILTLHHRAGQDAMLDLMMYMFPGYLSKALRQGLLKRYTQIMKNDATIKGSINIAQHIRKNIPFNGKIAYNQRHFSIDNSATQLIRHTIEFIRSSQLKSLLKADNQIKTDIALIESNTPSYNKNKRNSIITLNKKRKPHPYFTFYEPLLQLCIAILEHKKMKYSPEKKEIYGIIFSGSWLWEEYLNNRIFKPLGFIHPDNRRKIHPVYIFKGKQAIVSEDEEWIEKNFAPRYPDFMIYEKTADGAINEVVKMVADAKYRHHSHCGDRENLHQLLTYMYITQSKHGLLIYPIGINTEGEIRKKLTEERNYSKSIVGYGGEYYRIGFRIPEKFQSYKEFSEFMEQEEKEIKNTINTILFKS